MTWPMILGRDALLSFNIHLTQFNYKY
uniref:Uncharacterized protein n=1 Tax=Anopheles dirus TaxID=7168 RepID=A0A182NY09_9DIPT